ncbi:MAG: acyl-CoA dehydrogenase family protein, partial [Alphaproteobacteria bacterium]|nr:acyl-CoA dehydrogenase family protein [Alphaproteobacteria bacterium]
MDIALTEEEQRLVETARAFAADVVAPRAADWERDRVMPREAIRAAVEAGLGSLLVPKEHGGQGASRTTLARVA